MDTYEKKYNEALERAQKVTRAGGDVAMVIVQDIFPELAESEDERIRKYLIEELKAAKSVGELKFIIPQPTREECIAYLEKHKYDRMQPIYDSIDSFESALDKAWKAYNDSGARTVDGCEDDYVECAHAKGFREGYLFGLEKQKENPKSADSIPSDCVSDAKCKDKSPKHSDSDGTDIRDTPAYWKGWDDAMKQKEQKHPNGCFTCDEYKKGYESGRLNGFTAGYNKAMKEIDQKEQKPAEIAPNQFDGITYGMQGHSTDRPEDRFEEAREKYQVEWSDNDDQLIGFIFDLLNDLAWRKDWAMSKEECLERLKSIRPQPKQEWSEEDEKMMNRLIDRLNFIQYNTRTDGTSLNISFVNEIEWLKSLRPSWKPSEVCYGAKGDPDPAGVWKPSEEQIKAIESCFCEFGEGCPDEDGLRSLYNDLKKLI